MRVAKGTTVYLVTGGCGFIGSHLVEALLERGKQVRVLDDLSTGRRDNVPPSVEVIVGDVADTEVLRQACHEVDGCFHLAAVASVQRCNDRWRASHRTNLSAFIDLLDLSRPARHDFPVVFASSAAVYGAPERLPLSEDAATLPLSAYGADKLGCELHARAGATVHGTRSIGLRFFNVYGPRQDPLSPYSGVISIFAKRIMSGEPLTLFGDGGQRRDFVYVKDVAAALVAAMERAEQSAYPLFERLNVCTGEATTLLDLARTMMEVAGAKVGLERRPPRAGDIRDSVGDRSRICSELALGPVTSLERGLEALLDSLARPPVAAASEWSTQPRADRRLIAGLGRQGAADRPPRAAGDFD